MTLYAAQATSQFTSDLYSVDPITGITTSIGPIGYALTGMAWDPVGSTMYGAVSPNSAASPRSLITVDLVTGAGTLVGSFGGGKGMTDLACNSAGDLFGWPNSDDGLFSINKATGAATDLGGDVTPGFGGGIAFDSSDTLWKLPLNDVVGDDPADLYTIDTSTGNSTLINSISGYSIPSQNGGIGSAVIGPDGFLYAADMDRFSPGSTNSEIIVVYYPTGVSIHLSDLSTIGIDAIAFDVSPGPAPPLPPTDPKLHSPVGSNTNVALRWDSPLYDGGSAITGYNVYRGASSGTETLLASLGVVTTYNDGAVVNGTVYWYRITAVNANGEGFLSNEWPGRAGVPTATLYAAIGTDAGTSDIYSVDPVTGIMTSIGPTGYALTGLTWDVTTSTMYGGVSNRSTIGQNSLIEIDTVAGVGSMPIGFYDPVVDGITLGDIACDSAGNLFGWKTRGGQLFSINKTTGLATAIGAEQPNSFGCALFFDSFDNLLTMPEGDAGNGGYLSLVNVGTGVPTQVVDLSGYSTSPGGAMVAAKIGPDGLLYAVGNTYDAFPTPATHLMNVTYPPGVASFLSISSVEGVDAIAWNVAPGAPAATAPTAPRSLGAAAGDATVALSWTAPLLDGYSAITGYKVYRGATSGSETLLTTLGVVLVYNDNAVVNGNTYWYKVTAVNAAGESVFSNEVSASPEAATVPDPPTLSGSSGAAATLNWVAGDDGNSPITGYKVYRGTTSGGETLLASLGVVLTYEDASIVSGTTYYYKVTAINAIGESAFSNEISAFITNWTIASTAFWHSVYGIAYSPSLGKVVAVGKNTFDTRFAMYSDDGVDWLVSNSAPTFTTPWSCVCWSPSVGKFIAGRTAFSAQALLYSTDGINWTLTGPTGWQIQDVIWAEELSRFVAVGRSPTSGGVTRYSLSSPDGITWTPGTGFTQTGVGYGVAWSPAVGRMVMIGFFNNIASPNTCSILTSADGVSWATLSTGTVANSMPQIGRVQWFDSLNLFIGTVQSVPAGVIPTAGIVTSPDGTNWSSQTSTPFTTNSYNTTLIATAVGESSEGIAMAGGYGFPFSMASTTDGSHWSGQPSPFDSLTNSSKSISSICGIPDLSLTLVGLADY